MSLKLIIGRAGSGKTTRVLKEINDELKKQPLGGPLIMLTPEQASFQTEQALAKVTETGGFMRAQVLGFNRLALRVLQDAGGATRMPLGEMGRRMILRRLLEKRLPQLLIFGRAAKLPGFVDKLARSLEEMKAYRINADDLTDCLKQLAQEGTSRRSDLLIDKLTDLQMIYDDFNMFLQDRFIDPDDYLTMAAEKAPYSPWLAEAKVWVDGFVGFTPREYEVLKALLMCVGEVCITLTLDSQAIAGQLTEIDPFYPVWETYQNCLQIADKAKKPVSLLSLAQDAVPPRFTAQGLIVLENAYFTSLQNISALAAGEMSQGVILAVAADIRAEVESIAAKIIGLCRDHGYRWRDSVVLLRDMDMYSEIIAEVFADYGIPFFLDHKRSALHHPLVELIRASLQTVIDNWSYESVFCYLKTDLVPISREETDLLENYVLAYGIRGSRWYDEQSWQYYPRRAIEKEEALLQTELEELERVNSVRTKAVAALIHFQQMIKKSHSVADYTGALYGLLEELEIASQLGAWASEAATGGRLEEASEYGQMWESVVILLDEVVEALGDEALSLEQYLVILDAGLSALRLGFIPPGLDQVLVGSLDRSRTLTVKAAFLPGINEGVLPARMVEEGIFTESERDRLETGGLNLAPSVRRRVFDEQFMVYQALTRASERLVLSYLLADGEGRAMHPSPVVHRLKEIFPHLTPVSWQQYPGLDGAIDLDFITHPGRSLTHLAGRLRDVRAGKQVDRLWWDVYNWFVGRRQKELLFAGVMESLFYRNREGKLPPHLSRQLYGHIFKTGVSGLEQYRSCPFAHFLAKGLRLRDRAVFALRALDTGEFFHAALNMFVSKVAEQELDWGRLGETRCKELAGEVVDVLAPRLQSEILLSSARHKYLTGRLKKIVQRAVQVLAEHARRGQFRPIGLELSFGPQGELPGVIFTLPGGDEMLLTGRIDRLDAARTESELYLRVIDYKSGTTSIKLGDIWQGLKLQLLAYLEVALLYSRQLLGENALPGGVLYFRVEDPLLQTEGAVSPEVAETLMLKELSMKGLLLAENELLRLMDSSIGKETDILPVNLNKDGSYSARSGVLDKEQFNLLRAHLRGQLIGAGEGILAGDKEISPYRQGEFRYCRFCSYKSVCKFDLLTGNSYRIIRPEKDEVIWQSIKNGLSNNAH